MSKDNPAHPGNQPSNNPADAQDESSGKITRSQVTERNSPEKDLARGSEPETRGTSGRRQ